MAEGYLVVNLTTSSLPVAKLTDKAIEVLKGERKVVQRMKKTEQRSQALSNVNPDLFEQLRTLRYTISEREQVPPYMIFHDSTIKEMCVHLPLSKEAMLRIKGVGEQKYVKFGEEFLSLLQTYAEEHRFSSEEADPAKPSKEPSHLISYQMYRVGKTVAEIMEERNLSRNTVENHLFQCGMEGYPINWNDFIPIEYEELIMQKIEELGAQKLKPLKEALPEEIDYMAIKATIAKRRILLPIQN
jgi:ATP-dependent DNA helicase RecQ